jgi:hypothetical protein
VVMANAGRVTRLLSFEERKTMSASKAFPSAL